MEEKKFSATFSQPGASGYWSDFSRDPSASPRLLLLDGCRAGQSMRIPPARFRVVLVEPSGVFSTAVGGFDTCMSCRTGLQPAQLEEKGQDKEVGGGVLGWWVHQPLLRRLSPCYNAGVAFCRLQG